MLGAWVALASNTACGSCSSDTPARGSISVTWSITGLDRQPTTCEQVGAATVFVELRNRAGDTRTASFPCDQSPGTTEVVAGAYAAAFELRTPNGTTLAAAPTQPTVTVAAGQVTTLTPIAFAMDAKGILAISVAAPPFSSNCKPARDNGAGMTSNTITLETMGGSCAPVTFTRSRGTTVLGTYTVSCSSPVQAPCIETDETFTMPSMIPGAYIIHVRGLSAGITCWRFDGVLEMLPAGNVTRTLNLTQLTAPGC